MDVKQASAELKESGLTLGEVVYEAGAEEATWTVIAQSTAAGKRVKRGAGMDLTLAGAPPTDVPAVVGLSRAQAESEITSATLVVGPVTEQYDSVIPAGVVVSQEPTAGVSVPEGTSVSLLLSKGPQPIAVPNVVGAVEADATAALQAAGFTAAATPQDNAAPKGTVVSQTPAAGTLVLPGTAVTIAVSTGVEMVKVPNVFNLEDYVAEQRIKAAGLRVKYIWNETGSLYMDDPNYVEMFRIYRQSPSAGSTVARGSVVTVWTWGGE